MTQDWDVRVYRYSTGVSAWQRITLPLASVNGTGITKIDFERIDAGGYGNGHITLNTTWETYQLAGNERVDIYVAGTIRYRGTIRLPQNRLEWPESKVLDVFGAVEGMDKVIVTRQYGYPQPTDISQVITDLFNQYAPAYAPGAALSVQSIGVNLPNGFIDLRDLSFSAAVKKISDLAPAQVVWGWDVTAGSGTDASGGFVNRLYFWQRPGTGSVTTTKYKFAVGGNISALLQPLDSSKVINKYFINGGPAKQPNLMHNGGFEQPSPPGETTGNLLLDHSFEFSAEGYTPVWSFNNDASAKSLTDPGGGLPGSHTGSSWVALDQNGENITQVIPIVANRQVTGSAWIRRGTPATAATFNVFVIAQDGSGTALKTFQAFGAATDPISIPNTGGMINDGNVNDYQYVVFNCDLTTVPTPNNVASLKFQVMGYNGTNNNDGVIVDDCALYYSDAVAQAGWTSVVNTAPAPVINWAVPHAENDVTDPLSPAGGYMVEITAGTPGTNGYVEILTDEWDRPALDRYKLYSLIASVHVPTGQPSATVVLGSIVMDSKGNVLATPGVDSPATPLTITAGGWSTILVQWGTGSTAATCDVFFRLLNATTIYIDNVMLVEGTAPQEYFEWNYWPGANYRKVLDVSSLATILAATYYPYNGKYTGYTLLPGVANSISNYGYREAVVSNSDVIDLDGAVALAVGGFNATAVPRSDCQLTLDDYLGDVGYDGLIEIVNIANPPPPLAASRIQTTIADVVKMTIDLDNERPSLASLYRELAAAAGPATVAASGGGGDAGTSAQNSGGGVPTGNPSDSDLVHIDGTETITGAKTFSSAIRGNGGYESSDGTPGASTVITPATLGSKIADPTTALSLSLTTGLGGTFKAGDIVNLFYSWRTTNGYRTNVNTLSTITITANNQSVTTNQPATIPTGAVWFDLWVQGAPFAGGEFPPKLYGSGVAASAGATINVLEYISGGIGPPGENTTPLEGAGSGTAITVKDGLIT